MNLFSFYRSIAWYKVKGFSIGTNTTCFFQEQNAEQILPRLNKIIIDERPHFELLFISIKIFFDLFLDVLHKHNRLFKALLKKYFKFDSSKKGGLIFFESSFILLPTKIDFFSNKQSYKSDMPKIFNVDYVQNFLHY